MSNTEFAGKRYTRTRKGVMQIVQPTGAPFTVSTRFPYLRAKFGEVLPGELQRLLSSLGIRRRRQSL
jgi:hypothetical protein